MTRTRRHLSAAETAKPLRKALKARFPGQKFSVRSSSYAGGASIDIRWTDGPTEPEVNEIGKLFQGASFDGMTDMKSYHDALLSTDDGAEVVHFGADFVQTARSISPEWEAELVAELEAFAGESYDPNRRYAVKAWWGGRGDEGLAVDTHNGEYGSTLIHQMAYHRSRPATVSC